MAPLKARQGACVVGFNLNKAKAAKEEILKSFTPLELNEANVQAIFHRCLATEDSAETISVSPFPVITGYSAKGNKIVDFDEGKILANKRSLEYLFGQLQIVHKGAFRCKHKIKDFLTDYCGKQWTDDKKPLLEFLYLSVTPDIALITPFNQRDDETTSIMNDIKPTLSPKDPNFPAWWEQHKAEWEA